MNTFPFSNFPGFTGGEMSLRGMKKEVFFKSFRRDKGDYRLDLSILDDGLIRVSYVIDRVWGKSASYGVDPRFSAKCVEVEEIEGGECVELRTKKLHVVVSRSDLRVKFLSAADGYVLSEDIQPFEHSADDWTGDHVQRVYKSIRWNELFFGLGDKPCLGNLRGRQFEFWGSDYYAFEEKSDPLYKNIPFFIGLADKRCYGIFLDNTGRCSCDFGKAANDSLVLYVPGGRMDYFFFHESSPVDVIASYTRLTGVPDLPPLWALGYHQSRWSYYPHEVVNNMVERMRDSRIPCDAIYLDIHHFDENRVFTWNREYFPDPRRMVSELAASGMKVVTIVNPGIKIEEGNSIWEEGLSNEYYCRRHDGSLLAGRSWSEHCHFPDFTRRDVRDWWADLFSVDVGANGVAGIWADMNEPSIFPDRTFPFDTRHDCDGNPCSHSKAHNIYGHCMAEACREGIVRFGEGRRPFVLSRSGYAGMQRFAATWTGDNCSTWEHLKIANAQCQRLSASGVSFCGADVGGFLEYPTPELFCRWMQMGAFFLLFRNHSSGDYGRQEPWGFGEHVTNYVREAVEVRYKLLPYFYTQFYRYSSAGVPVIRSLSLQCAHESDTNWRKAEFFVGEHLYVVPVLDAHADVCRFYAPAGTWYSLWDDKRLSDECADVAVEVALDRIPVFVRGGAVIPQWPVQQYVGELKEPDLTLHVWYMKEGVCESELYEDGLDGQEYRNGDFLLHRFSFVSKGNGVSLSCSREGRGQHFHGKQVLMLHAFPTDAQSVHAKVDGQDVVVFPCARRCFSLVLPDDFGVVELTW